MTKKENKCLLNLDYLNKKFINKIANLLIKFKKILQMKE